MSWKNEYLPWPIRGIANFIQYAKYAKKLDQKNLQQLKKDIKSYGFNEGVELFHELYHSEKRMNRIMNPHLLAAQATKEVARRKADQDEAAARAYYQEQENKKYKWKQPEMGTFDPNWNPTLDELAQWDSSPGEETEYKGLYMKWYSAYGCGTFVAVLYLKDGNANDAIILKDKNALDLHGKIRNTTRDMAARFGLQRAYNGMEADHARRLMKELKNQQQNRDLY